MCLVRAYIRNQWFIRFFAIALREDQFLFEEEMHETENWSMDGNGGRWADEGGGGGLWYFANSCSIDGALKLINSRRQSASFVLSSILNVSACCTRFAQTRVSSIPEGERRSSISWSRLESLPGISLEAPFSPFRDLSARVQYDGCDNSSRESTRARLKF